MAKELHDNATVSKAGLFIDAVRPYIGASPDGIVNCNCCGQGVICPYFVKEGLPEDDMGGFCMTKTDDKWSLKRNHTYFYQIQLQMAVCKVDYGDFVVWTEKEFVIERIKADPSFGDMIMCDNDKCTIKWFHFECLRIRCIPKGKWYCPSCCKLSKFSRKKC